MMRKMIFLLVVLVSICSFAWADTKVSVESNVNSILTAKDYAHSDAKLMQKVSYEAKFKSVQLILDDLREMTGVRFVAGARDSDWVVRSRKMNIFVKDIPLSDLMDSIARVMRFRWGRNDDVKPSIYRLLIDKKAAAAADAIVKKVEKDKEAMWQSRRDAWIDAIMQYGSLSPSDFESMRETNPVVYEYGRRGAIQGICALFKDVPETKDRFRAGQSFRICADELSPEAKSQLFFAGNELWKYLQRVGFICEATNNPPGYTDELKIEDKFDIAFNRMDTDSFTPGLRWGAGCQDDTGYFHIRKAERDFEIAGLPTIDTPWDRFRSTAHNKIIDGNDRKDAWAVSEQDSAKINSYLKEREELFHPSEPLLAHEPSPEFDKKIKLTIEPGKPDMNPALAVNTYIASLQKAIFDATGMGIVSDSWTNVNGEKLIDQDATLDEVLEKFSKNFNYNWDKQGSILQCWHRQWALMRFNQLSDELVTKWREDTKKNKRITLDDLTDISNITYEQCEESLKCDEVFGGERFYGWMIDILDTNGNVIWMRLYSKLTPQQRQLIMGDYGLNGFMLTSSQWKLAQPMFDRIGSTRGDALFRMRQVPNDDVVLYHFIEVDTDSDSEDRVWEAGLPIYDPPPAEKDKK